MALLGGLTQQLSIAIKNVLFTQELKEANEELLHVDQLKSDFLATMSHELRTPLTAIIGYTDMLMSGLMGEMQDTQKGLLRNVLNSSEALLTLINDILDITKIEAGKLELNLEPVELRSVLISVLAVVKPRARDKQIQTIHVPSYRSSPDPGRPLQARPDHAEPAHERHSSTRTSSVRWWSRPGRCPPTWWRSAS